MMRRLVKYMLLLLLTRESCKRKGLFIKKKKKKNVGARVACMVWTEFLVFAFEMITHIPCK